MPERIAVEVKKDFQIKLSAFKANDLETFLAIDLGTWGGKRFEEKNGFVHYLTVDHFFALICTMTEVLCEQFGIDKATAIKRIEKQMRDMQSICD